MKKIIALLVTLSLVAFTSDKNIYKLYDAEGKKADWEKLVKDASAADVVFFGELHDNPVSHWLQLQLLKELHKNKAEKVVVGAEMFESDDQIVIDEFLSGWIKDTHLETEAKIWKNYKTDYKSVMSFCKDKKLRFIATNIPRRYASLVSKESLSGLDKLSADAKKMIAPLPISFDKEVPCYKQMIADMDGQGHGMGMNAEWLAQAQASKDATMAYFISKNWKSGTTFYHLNGAYHSDNKDGIIYYLKKLNPGIKIVTISTVEQDDIETLAADNKSKADYVVATPTDLIKTH